MKSKKMQSAMQLGSGYDLDGGAWRMPGADPTAYTNMDVYVKLMKIAERGKIQVLGNLKHDVSF